MKKRVKLVIGIVVLLLFCGLYLYYENTALTTTSYKVASEKIPDAFNHFKIAQVSDLHNTDSEKLMLDLIDEIREQTPDIIVLTGDLIDASRTDIDIAVGFIECISDIAPIYFVTGNHEASIGTYSELVDKLVQNNVIILDNRTSILEREGANINVIGIHDPQMAHEKAADDSEIVNTELNDADFNSEYYSILLSHRPELLTAYVSRGIDLVLSGHAHGGQIRLPFIGGIVAPNQGLFPEYTSGVHIEGSTSMIVSRGIGNSILPFRINNRPELVMVELVNG